MWASAACRIAGLRSLRIDQQWIRSGCAVSSMYETARCCMIDADVLLNTDMLLPGCFPTHQVALTSCCLYMLCAGGDTFGEHPDVRGDGGAGQEGAGVHLHNQLNTATPCGNTCLVQHWRSATARAAVWHALNVRRTATPTWVVGHNL